MFIKCLSDLHLEHNNAFTVPHHVDDENTVLILAGDIGVINSVEHYLPMIQNCASRFRKVLYVPGNHEFYDGYLYGSVEKLKESVVNLNCVVLDNEEMILDDVTFIGSTLWTDYDGNNPVSKSRIRQAMSDYRLILPQKGARRTISPDEVYNLHLECKRYITDAIAAVGTDKSVVITHHAPSQKSVSPQFYESSINGAFYSDLSDLIYDARPNLWVHGHMHQNCDYVLYGTRVICNPRGYYPHEINAAFDPNHRLRV